MTTMTMTLDPSNEAIIRNVGLAGRSEVLAEAARRISMLSHRQKSPVIIIGEPGTGRRQIAQAIHRASGYVDNQCFFSINGIDFSSTKEVERLQRFLFGYERGSLPNSPKRVTGYMDLMTEGTFFIENAEELSPQAQSTLAHYVDQGQEYHRFGEQRARRTNVRVVVSASSDIRDRVSDGRFSEALYMRLSTIWIDLTPLAERQEDVEPLLNRLNAKLECEGDSVSHFSEDARSFLSGLRWAGGADGIWTFLVRSGVRFKDRGMVTKEDLDGNPDLFSGLVPEMARTFSSRQ